MRKTLHITLLFFMMLLTGAANAETVTFDATVDKGSISDYNMAGADEVSKNGIKISISSGVLGLGTHYRIYKKQTMTVSSSVGNITGIEITCIASGADKYGPGCFTSPTSGTYTFSGMVGTWSGASSSVTLTASEDQVRTTRIVVTYSASSATKKAAELAFSETSVTGVVGKPFTAPTLTKATTASVQYSSDNTDVATVDANSGAVTLKAAGTVKITATAAENDEYYEGSASYTIQVNSEDFTSSKENPLTVAKVMAAYANGETISGDVYIKGIVTQVDEISAQHGNATYCINDTDSKDGQLKIYRGMYIDGEKFTSTDQLAPGDEVIVCGKMTVYNDAPQMAQGNMIVSLKKGSSSVVDITNTPETAYTVAKANELIAAGEGLVNSVYVKGVISKIDEVSVSYGNAGFYINDTNTEEGQLQVYRCKYLNNEKFTAEDQIAVGDNVVIYGQLKNYNGTFEITNCYVYSIEKSATGIEGVEADKMQNNGEVYDLSGKVVPASRKGIVIVGGKKIIRK